MQYSGEVRENNPEADMTYSITPLLTGVRNPDQGIMTYQKGYGKRIWLPIWAFLVQGAGHNILVILGLQALTATGL